MEVTSYLSDVRKLHHGLAIASLNSEFGYSPLAQSLASGSGLYTRMTYTLACSPTEVCDYERVLILLSSLSPSGGEFFQTLEVL